MKFAIFGILIVFVEITECHVLQKKPEVLFFQPEVYGARDCKIPLVDNRELNDVEREYSQRPPELGLSQEFLTIARAAVGELNLQHPP